MHTVEDVSAWPTYGEEHVGSKPKVWLLDPRDQRSSRWLWKQPRPGTGEHWAEVAVAGIAHCLGIPHAHALLARRHGGLGSISLDFLGPATLHPELVLGNTLLATTIGGYDQRAAKPSLHTVDAALELLRPNDIAPALTVEPPPEHVSSADAWFVGYLLLDALVGNTDRHHENWGLIVRRYEDATARSFDYAAWSLAPTFDHASSLGRDLDDATRDRRLTGKDPRVTVEHYAARGRSPLFGVGDQPRQLTTREAFARALELRPEAGAAWLHRLAKADERQLHAAIDLIPPAVASDAARAFARAVVGCNRTFLLTLRNQS